MKDQYNKIKNYTLKILKLSSIALSSFYIFLGLIGIFFSEEIIFPHPPPSYTDNDDFKQLRLKPGFKITISETSPPKGTPNFYILYNHGNGVDLGDIQFKLKEMALYLNSFVISYDYPSYGTSTGSPSEKNVYETIEMVYQYLQKKCKDSKRIIIWGRSVGSGPATYLAAKHPGHPLILESPFLSAFRVVTRYPIVPFDKFSNIAIIRNINAPLLILHGKKDKTIPFFHGEKLYKTADPPKQFIIFQNAGHNNLINTASTKYWNGIKEFINSIKNDK